MPSCCCSSCCCCCSLCALSICATIWKIFDKNKIKLDILPRHCHRAAPCRIDLSNNYETRAKQRLSSKADYVIMSVGELIVKYQIYIWIYLNIECQILPRALLYIDIFSPAIKIPACRRVFSKLNAGKFICLTKFVFGKSRGKNNKTRRQLMTKNNKNIGGSNRRAKTNRAQTYK